MKHKASRNFWSCYRQLPVDVQQLADHCYELLKQNPRYPSLHFKKIGRFWTVRVGLHYREIATEEDNNSLVWFWIGSHAEYDQLLG